MTRIVVLGDVMVDVVVRLAGPLASGSDAPARISFHGGGSAANVAAWLASEEPDPLLVGRLGDDARGEGVRRELVEAGVDARMAVDPDWPTGTCIVLVAADGERTMAPDPGANDHLAAEDLPDELLVAGGHLHVSGYALLRPGSRDAARTAIARARARRMSVSVDPSSAALLTGEFCDLAEGAQLLLPNQAEARVLTGEDDPERAALMLARRFPEVVVKLGAEGALWCAGTHVVWAGPEAVAAGAVDTTGAGDAFAAGLIIARMDGAQPEAALAAACRLASRAVGTPGARPPLPRRPPAERSLDQG
jgi:sugar/nucleoside kinase (ribokinase family)